jgi:hypothetical protein
MSAKQVKDRHKIGTEISRPESASNSEGGEGAAAGQVQAGAGGGEVIHLHSQNEKSYPNVRDSG